MGGDGEPQPQPEPEEIQARKLEERFGEEHLARTASAKIGLGAMETELERARAEMEAEITREEEEKAGKRATRRSAAGGGFGRKDERRAPVPVARPTSAGRRPGSGKRLAPLHQQRAVGAGGWDDEAQHPAGGDYFTSRDEVLGSYPGYDGGGDGGGPPPDGGARGALLTSSLVTVDAPAVDHQQLSDALTTIVTEEDELRLDVEDEQPFTDRVHDLIDARIAPPITDIYRTLEKREQEFQAFVALATGRLDKLDNELSQTKQQLHYERIERKKEHAALKTRVLRAESAITEKAEQQELDALLRSVITTVGSMGQRIGEGEANLAAVRVAQTQTQEQMVVVRADVVVAREKEAVDVAALESSLQELHNKQEQLAAKVGKWQFGEGTSLMDAMWQRSREERVASIVTADLEVLREREAINLDDTSLEETDWLKLFGKFGRCIGDGKQLQLKRLSLHGCNLPEGAAEKLGVALAYACPDLEFLSLRGNPELGHDGWSTIFSKIAAGGGLQRLVTLNLQQCNIPHSCKRELQSMFRACPALISVEVGGGGAGEDDTWIEELWQSIDASESAEAYASLVPPTALLSNGGETSSTGLLLPPGSPAGPTSYESAAANTVARRVAGAGALASAAASAFGADMRDRPASAEFLVRAQQAEVSFPGEIARTVAEIDTRVALAEATNLQSQLDSIPAEFGGNAGGGDTANTPIVPPRDDGEEGEGKRAEKTMEERMAEAREMPAGHVV